NNDSWNRLTPEEQTIIDEKLVGVPMARKAGRIFDEQREKGEKEAKESGVEFIELPDEEIEKFKEASKDVSVEWIRDMEEQGINGKKIYDEAVRLIDELKEE